MEPETISSSFGVLGGVFGLLLWPILIWTGIWKAIALWKAARNSDKVWYVVLLLVNTVGILEIIYIYVINKKKAPARTASEPVAPTVTST